MKKTVALVLVVITLISMFAGCSGTKSYKPEDGYRVLNETLDAEEYGVGFRNADIALGLEVSRLMDEMIADGTAATISEKWFGSDVLIKTDKYLEESEVPADDNSLNALKERGTFILGLDDSFPPMGYRDDNNNVVGFDIDLATEVCKRMGVELKIQPIDWDAKELELTSGKIDCIWNGMTINDGRIANMFFAKPYIANEQIIIVPTKSDIESISDLKGRTVGLQKGSSSLEALNKNPISGEIKTISEYPENVSVFMDLKANRIEAFIVDSVAGRYIMSNN